MKYDLIIVLAGGITSQGSLPESVKKRILLAKKFYRLRLSAKILFSGRWSEYWQHLPPLRTEAAMMLSYARKQGFPPKGLLIEEYSQNTYQNAFFAKKLFLEPNNWKRVLVITSDFHVPRTKIIFSELLSSEYHIDFLGTLTNDGFLRSTQRILKEFLSLGSYWFFQHIFKRS